MDELTGWKSDEKSDEKSDGKSADKSDENRMKNWLYPSAQRNGDPLLMFLWCGTLSCVVVFPGSTDSQNLGR